MQMYSALPFCELLNIPILFISCLVRLAWASLWTVRLACHGGRCYLLDQQTGIVSAVELQSKIRKNFTITEKATTIHVIVKSSKTLVCSSSSSQHSPWYRRRPRWGRSAPAGGCRASCPGGSAGSGRSHGSPPPAWFGPAPLWHIIHFGLTFQIKCI